MGFTANSMLPACPWPHNSGLYWPRRGYAWKPGKVIIEFLPPIAPGLKRKEFMAAMQDTIESATNRLVAEGQK